MIHSSLLLHASIFLALFQLCTLLRSSGDTFIFTNTGYLTPFLMQYARYLLIYDSFVGLDDLQ